MQKKQTKQAVIIMGLCAAFLMFNATAFAAGEIPWDTPLSILTDHVRTIARSIVSIFIAVTGVMVLFDAGSANTVRVARIVLGVGLALNVADFIVADDGMFRELFVVISGNVDKPPPPHFSFGGQDKGVNFIGQFVTYYEQMCVYGASMLIPSALKVMAALVVIDMTMTLAFKLEGDHIQYLMSQILKIGFFIFLVQNWVGGVGALSNIANTIFTSFEQIGINASGMTSLKPENILANGFDVVNMIVNGFAGNVFKGSIILAIVQIVVALATFLCVSVTVLSLIMCRLEFWTISLIIVPLIPFGLYQHTRFLFERAIGAIFNMGIKMAIITFICTVAGPLLSGLVQAFGSAEGFTNNIVSLLMVFFGALCIAVLSFYAPSVAAGYFNGQPSLSGGSMSGMAMNAAKTSAGAAGAIMQASNMEGGATALKTIGKAGGQPTNFGLRQLGTMRNLATMANQAYNPFSQGYNSTQASVRDRMTRNLGNSNVQERGHYVTKDEDGNMTAGWGPTANANLQNADIAKRLRKLEEEYEKNSSKKT